MGGHGVPYDFAPFLDTRAADPSDPEEDPLLWAWLERSRLDDETVAWVRDFARRAATQWREAGDFAERAENLPCLAGKGPFDNDPQQVVLPAETWESLADVHGSGLWRRDLDERARYAAVYLLNQNGEAGVACSVACTDGLLRVLRAHPDERTAHVVASIEEATREEWVHAAQFVTEVQGGSDAGANAVAARDEGDGTWSLWGQKWFCSNCTADWWLVTARPEHASPGPPGVALFLVERDQPGYTLERLKDKVGTRALPTAEILFHGARGMPVGPLDRGLATMVGEVLVPSRIHNVVAAAAFLRSAQREARAYAAFRTAFGQRLDAMPLVVDILARLDATADRAEAGAFATVDVWLASHGPDTSDDVRLWARVLVSLAKAVATRRLPGLLHEAISVLGGNGIEERFTILPRLWRDSIILETWEGPYTLLLAQALRDLQRGGVAGREEAFLRAALAAAGGLPDEADEATAEARAATGAGRRPDDTSAATVAAALAKRLARLLADPDDPGQILAWKALAHDLYGAWAEGALAALPPQAGASGGPSPMRKKTRPGRGRGKPHKR